MKIIIYLAAYCVVISWMHQVGILAINHEFADTPKKYKKIGPMTIMLCVLIGIMHQSSEKRSQAGS